MPLYCAFLVDVSKFLNDHISNTRGKNSFNINININNNPIKKERRITLKDNLRFSNSIRYSCLPVKRSPIISLEQVFKRLTILAQKSTVKRSPITSPEEAFKHFTISLQKVTKSKKYALPKRSYNDVTKPFNLKKSKKMCYLSVATKMLLNHPI